MANSAVGGSGGGGATNLPGLTDVADNIVYTAGFVVRADGAQYTGARLDHTDLTTIGTNTHAQLDSHVASTSNPHSVTAAQAGAVALTGNEAISGVKTFNSYPVGPQTGPNQAGQLVDKAYVDTVATTGTRFVDALNAATAAALPTNVYNNGSSGVGATMTAVGLGVFPTIDGVVAALNNTYLIKNETVAFQNGAYQLTTLGSALTSWVLTRTTNYDQSAEIVTGTFFNVLAGTVQGNTQWTMNVNGTITIGTTPITFAQLSAPPAYTATLGVQKVGNDFRANVSATGAITLSGNTLQVAPDNSSLELASNAIRVKALGITNAMLAGSITDDKLSTISTTNKVNWVAVNKAGSVLADIANTNISAPVNGQSLVWNSATSKWIASTVSGSGGGGTNSLTSIPRPDVRRFFFGAASNTAINMDGGVAGVTQGTVSNNNQTTSTFIKFTPSSSSLSNGGYAANTYNLVRRQHNPTYYCQFRTGPDMLAQRIWIGLFTNVPTSSDNINGMGIALRFSTIAGDTTFKYVTKDGATQTVTDSGVTPAGDTTYSFMVVVDSTAATAVFTIDAANSQTVTASLPAAASDLGYANLLFNTTSTAKPISLSTFYCEFTGTALGLLSSAPSNATYVTLSTDTTLTNERVLTGTSGNITITDGGAGANVVLDVGSSVVTLTGTQTLTNKRITARVSTITSSATPTPNGNTDDEFTVTALAAGATFGAPTGTPTEGQLLLVRIKDNGTARSLAFNAIYRFSSDLAAPTTTIISKTLYLLFAYNATDSKWDMLDKRDNF